MDGVQIIAIGETSRCPCRVNAKKFGSGGIETIDIFRDIPIKDPDGPWL